METEMTEQLRQQQQHRHSQPNAAMTTSVAASFSGDDARAVREERGRGRRQLAAMLRRQWLLKTRNWQQTLLELLSPALLILLLIYAYHKSHYTYHPAQVYANDTVPFFDNLHTAHPEQLVNGCMLSAYESAAMQGGSPADTVAITAAWMRVFQAVAANPAAAFANPDMLKDLLAENMQELGPAGADPILALLACLNSSTDVMDTLSRALRSNGPLPVPSLDAFVLLHKALKAILVAQGKFDQAVRSQQHFGNLFGNLLELGRVVFVPNDERVQSIAGTMKQQSVFFDEVYAGEFATEKEALAYALGGEVVWAVVVFNELGGADEGVVDYSLRLNYTTVPRTWRPIDRWHHDLRRDYRQYYTSGFLSLQRAVDDAILTQDQHNNILSGPALLPRTVWGVPFPIGNYRHNFFYDAVGPLLGLVVCISTLYPLAMLVRGIVEEKETRAKETMAIMGLKTWVFYSAWAATYVAIFMLATLAITLLVTFSFLPNSSPTLIFAFLFLYAISEIPFAFLVSTFFSKAKLAAIAAPMIHFISILPRYLFFRSASTQALAGKSLVSLLSPTAFTFGADLFAQYEGADIGLTWRDIGETEFPLAWIMALMLFDTFLYAALAWYLDKVLPSEYGAQLPPLFLFKKSYWWPNSSRLKAHNGIYERVRDDDGYDVEVASPGGTASSNPDFEPVPEGWGSPSVSMKGLKKVYGAKVAVNDLDLNIYSGHITALLGHNGAGKTTAISILTGLTPPTAGDCLIHGHSIVAQLALARSHVGVCPQHNVLFSNLTVREHLRLYAAIKGMKGSGKVDAAVDELAAGVGLTDKLDEKASALSGGMKRKLQVAIALIGDSRVVLLDEPTSGMDPHSRRAMWELLKKYKAGRTLVLTTHYMDEADILCDRIAIVSEGKLRCCGSSLFLKSRYGVGYTLTLTRGDAGVSDVSGVAALVQRHVGDAAVNTSKKSNSGEITYSIPVTATASFPALFEELEGKREALSVGSYGVSMTTLEDVFLRLSNDNLAYHTKDEDTCADTTSQQVDTEDHVVGYAVADTTRSSTRGFWRAAKEVFRKRVIIAKRDIKGALHAIALPVAVIALVLLILKLDINPAGPSLELSSAIYSPDSLRAKAPTLLPVAGISTDRLADIGVRKNGRHAVDIEAVGDSVSDSLGMSLYLLDQLGVSAVPRYAALVYNDTILQSYNISQDQSALLALVELARSADLPTDINGTEVNIDPAQKQMALDNVSAEISSWRTGPFGQGLRTDLTILHNTSSYHAFPAFINELRQADYRRVTGNPTAMLTVRSHPMPLTPREALTIQTYLTVLAGLFVLVPFCYLAATFAVFIVRERTTKALHLQLVSGCSPLAYWSATYLWDVLNYIVIAIASMIVFLLYGDKGLIGSFAKGAGALALLVFYGLAVIPLSYCYSFAFQSHSAAQVAISGLHFIAGFVMIVASVVMAGIPETRGLNDVLVRFYRLLPPFNLGEGLIALSSLDLREDAEDYATSPLSMDILGRPLLYLGCEAVGFFILTVMLESGVVGSVLDALKSLYCHYRGHWKSTRAGGAKGWAASVGEADDVDVARERERVDQGLADNDSVVIKRLNKVYAAHKRPAVVDLTFGIPVDECFGLLGVNGAGKTTTLSILTGDIKPSSGDAYIAGHSVRHDITRVRQHIGYCPQFDPILDLMTAREQLRMYSRLKGIPESAVPFAVDGIVRAVGLWEFADRLSGTYSGGNKRKLSLAMALVGDPSAVFLDEPSSGMDPAARRSMWAVVSATTRGRSVILTTHSMEECEALCGRLGIMVAGRLVCVGSPQHLKSRFGEGYHLEIKAAGDVRAFVKDTFPSATLVEHHGERVKYQLPMKNLSLAAVFRAVESNRVALGISDYAVSQSSLEQVFISFAKQQTDDDEEHEDIEEAVVDDVDKRDDMV
eukprot:jgi/Chlat1/9014/Chrsp94S08294